MDAHAIREREHEAVVIVPTYDEALTVGGLVEALLERHADVEVLVVDDGSPDGTADVVRALPEHGVRVFLLARTRKSGLGSAYRAGFRWARERGYRRVVQMDADLSHPVERVAALLTALDDGADLAIGSRYVPGGELVNWPLRRRLLSRWGNAYVRLVLGLPIADATAGFRAYRMDLLAQIGATDTESDGYCFQIETTWRSVRAGASVVEVPITFTERVAGTSKMSADIAVEAIVQVARWRARELTGVGVPPAVLARSGA